jgi:DNA-binding NarL/FixJ family response regulator
VILADDHSLVRAGIILLLEKMPGIEVAGEADDGYAALRLAESNQPDVVLMDIMMPGLNGLEATVRLSKDFPPIRVLVLSMNANEEYVLQALRAGAAGYLLKNVSPTELELAIRAVARGETYLSSAVSKHVISSYMERTGGLTSTFERLTPRQREVLQLVAEGHTTKEIAQMMGVAVKTVETFRTQLMHQLDIHEIAGLVRYAIAVGLVPAAN